MIQVTFQTQTIKELINRVEALESKTSIDTSNFATLGDNSLFGVEILAETLKDTFDTFKAGLGIKDSEPEKLSTKCSFCGAPLSGTVKQTVKCSFCDMEQTL